jgi:hypothetical protein
VCSIGFEELPGELQHLRTSGAGHEPKESDADEAARQPVRQEPAQKFVGGNAHLAFLIAVRVVFPTEGDRFAVKDDEPVIGDRHAVRVPVLTGTGLLMLLAATIIGDRPFVRGFYLVAVP